jgi:hypothetical protein
VEERSTGLEWGHDMTMLCHADFNYLPGAYALFNSAIDCCFKGVFVIYTKKEGLELPKHAQLRFEEAMDFVDGRFHSSIQRLNLFSSLEDGKYIFIDSDFIIERPCGILFEALEEGLVLSTEPYLKYDFDDVKLFRQCQKLGLSNEIEPYHYINCGLIGFQFPRDKELMLKWVSLSKEHLNGMTAKCRDPYEIFHFQQDIFNLLVRQKGVKKFSISHRNLELANFETIFQERVFPWTKQGDLLPADQVKFLIHGASLRRPWLNTYGKSLKGRLRKFLYDFGITGFLKKPTPYERAWAYYACGDELPISFNFWGSKYRFDQINSSLIWKRVHGLR